MCMQNNMYRQNVRGIFVCGTYFTIIYEVFVVVACIFIDICKTVGSIYPFSLLPLCLIFAVK